MKRIKGIATILMVVCMLVSFFMFNSTYAFADTVRVAPATPTEKIDAAIWDTAPDENGRYLVYISRDSITDESIENEFNKRNEFDLSDYKDKKTFRWEIGSSIAMNAFEKYGMRETFDIEVGRELFNDELVPIEYEFIEYYNGYLENKRQVISDLYEDYNKSFVDARIVDEDTVLYEGIYTGSYILYATQDEIQNIAEDNSVLNITVWENAIVQQATNSVHTQIHTDSSSGTKSTNFNNGNGYKGTGIKVGIIEACEFDAYKNAYYVSFNPYSPQLAAIYNSRLFYVDTNGNISQPSYAGDHANLVTSIIVGQSSIYNNQTYEGVVPKATVYQTTAATTAETLSSIQKLVTNFNVSVINYSAGINNLNGSYTSFDSEIDALVKSVSISFVCAAGNYNSNNNPNNAIASPALGYNVITVGNLNTKGENGNLITTSTFNVSNISSYVELGYLTNKPDIVAPGTNIACRVTDGVKYSSGTSFAAPFVTGVVAQLFHADETLMDSPTKTKAVLLAGADPTKVSTSNNGEAYTGSSLIREKSGVGMLNAVNSIEIAENGDYNNIALFLNSTGVVGDHYIDEVTLSAGQTIRIVLTYNKPDDALISTTGYQNNAGVKLYNGSTLCVSSNFVYSNVEVIEYTATTSGTYTIKAFAQKYAMSQSTTSWVIAVAWDVINR